MKIIGKVFITNNSEQTKKLGRDFAKVLKKGDVVCLYGDLGSGKTTFVQGVAKGLGIEKRIISPTFIIVRCYELQSPAFAKASTFANASADRSAGKQNSKLKSLERFYHIDLYRVESENDLKVLGIEEILEDKNAIILVEWAEKLKSLMPKKRIDIDFLYEKDNARKITFRSLNK